MSEELGLGLVAISEPNRVPDNDRWLASIDNPPSAAFTWQWSQGAVLLSGEVQGLWRWTGERRSLSLVTSALVSVIVNFYEISESLRISYWTLLAARS